MKIHLSPLIFFIGLMANAQMILDVFAEPKPIDFVITSLFPELRAPMKKMTWVKINDSLKTYELNRKGDLVTEYDYYNNKRGASTTYTYTGRLKTQSVYNTKSGKDIIDYKYTPSGKYAEWGRVTEYINTKTSRLDVKWAFEYDDKDGLIKKYSVDANNIRTLNSEYIYDSNNRLIEAITNNQWKSVFQYDLKGNLINRVQSLNNTGESIYSYEYDNENRVIKQKNSFYTADFIYEKERMVQCVYTLSNQKKEIIDFVYKDGLLSEVKVQQNDFLSFSPFRLSSNYQVSDTNNFRIEILIDNHKNTKELKYYVNDLYKYSEEFIIEYY